MEAVQVASVTATLHAAGLTATRIVRRVRRSGYNARQVNAYRVAVFFTHYGERRAEMEAAAERALCAAGYAVSRPFQNSNGVLFVTHSR
jgi:hypothetical protein